MSRDAQIWAQWTTGTIDIGRLPQNGGIPWHVRNNGANQILLDRTAAQNAQTAVGVRPHVAQKWSSTAVNILAGNDFRSNMYVGGIQFAILGIFRKYFHSFIAQKHDAEWSFYIAIHRYTWTWHTVAKGVHEWITPKQECFNVLFFHHYVMACINDNAVICGYTETI